MFSNLLSQLKSQRVSHLLPQVLEEVPRVREDLGYPPLVTPTSQIVGVQAVLNTISGERYKLVTKEVERYVKGYYGRPPAEVSQYLRDRILGDETSLECRAADLIPAEVESSREQIGLLAKTDEDLLTYLLLGEVGKSFLLRKYRSSLGVDFSLAEKHSEGLAVYPI
jgi:oxaloacetate decarboxylase alpha subunit